MKKSMNPLIQCESLQNQFPKLLTQLAGDAMCKVAHVSPPEAIRPQSIVFVAKAEMLTQVLVSPEVAAVVVPEKLFAQASVERGQKTLLASPNVELAMAKVISHFFLATPYRDPTWKGVHPTAVVHSSAILGENVTIAPYSVIAEDVEIGAHSSIGSHVVIERGAKIGTHTTLQPFVLIGHHCEIGDQCEIHAHTVIGKEGFGYAHDERGNHVRIPHQGKVVIENDVHIGSNCAFDRSTFLETRIGAGTKIDNHVHIAHNCKIGQGSIITAGFIMAGSSSVGKFFLCGGRANVTGHVHVTDHVQISGLSAVSKDVKEPGSYGGVPLLPLQEHLRMKAASVHLPEMRKQVAKLMKKVFPDEITK
jgi:UDP-3-O-[3-hydroxymyristoyl] glucosamine N-acyltransferase